MSKNWQTYSAMTAALAVSADDLLVRDKSDTTDHGTEGTVLRLPWEGLLGLSGITPGGRLTLESGVPVSTTDQTAKGTLYYTPYAHDFVRLYNGTRPTLYTFTERSLSLTLTSGKNYDVFLYDNAGTLTLELSAAWTNDTTRADALAWQAGVGYVKSGTATRLHLGTIRASGTNTTESSFEKTDAAPKSFICNRYNVVRRTMRVIDSTDSYTYTSATWRQSRGNAANQCEFVACSPSMVVANAVGCTSHSGAAGRATAVGFDSTSSPTGTIAYSSISAANGAGHHAVHNHSILAAGYHYVSQLEYAAASGTCTWYGDAGLTYLQSGLSVEVDT